MNAPTTLRSTRRVLANLKRQFRSLFFGRPAKVVEELPTTATHARPPPRPRVAVARADEPAVGFTAHKDGPVERRLAARVVASYTTPSANTFLEVSRARPQFEGHAQPRLPSAFSFCLEPSTLKAQAELAWQYGIDAFAFEFDAEDKAPQPAAMFCSLGGVQLSFCLVLKCADLGRSSNLVAQLQPFLADPRYLLVGNRSVLVIEGLVSAQTAGEHLAQWRDAVRRQGLGEQFVVARQFRHCVDPTSCGFDAVLPQLPPPDSGRCITDRQSLINPAFRGEVFDWRVLPEAPCYTPGALAAIKVGADDEPVRPGEGQVFAHASPRAYGDWLCRSLVAAASRDSPLNELVFVDSWNDWRQGAVLEPDTRLGHGYLNATRNAVNKASRQLAGMPALRDCRPCAVVHVYYVELVDEIAVALLAAHRDWRVVVTTQADRAEAVRTRLAHHGISAEIEVHENRGRDILPFLRVANRLVDEGVDVVLKLHTKQSVHLADGAAWRAQLIGRLVEPARAMRICEAFEHDPAMGWVGPEGHVLHLAKFWGANEETVRHLCVRMGVPEPERAHDQFVAGSMFWVRLSALRPLLDAHLGEWEFAPEQGYIDGTMAHAVERAISLAVKGAGFKTATAADICGVPFVQDSVYAFAGNVDRTLGQPRR